MPYVPTTEDFVSARALAETAAGTLAFDLSKLARSGNSGNLLGKGTGSSVDFHDHRPYVPGDDPRYINWQAYARSGNYTMKLFREEISLRMDIIFDASASVFSTQEKTLRALELLYFALARAKSDSSTTRIHLVAGAQAQRIASTESVPAEIQKLCKKSRELNNVPAIEELPLQSQTFTIFITDLLFPGLPDRILRPLIERSRAAVVFCVNSPEEANPDWQNFTELSDAETKKSRIVFADENFIKEYHANYLRHFSLWRDALQRVRWEFCSISSKAPFISALTSEPIAKGVLKTTR